MRKSEIEALLTNLAKEELIQIIVQVAEEDEAFRTSLKLKYYKGERTKQIQTCKKLIKSIVKKYTGREGFIYRSNAYAFAMEILSLFNDTDEIEDPMLALEIAFLVLQEGIDAFQYADDSDGDIGMLVHSVLEQIDDLAGSMRGRNQAEWNQFFQQLVVAGESPMFQDWDDFRIILFRISADMAVTETLQLQLRAALERQIAYNEQKEYGNYQVEELHKLIFQLILNDGTNEEADHYAQEYLHISFFRERIIGQHMQKGDYRHVIELAEEGERQDQNHLGLLTKWRKTKYVAYKKLSLKQEQEQLARELLLDGDYSYYNELESLNEGSKEDLYRGILADLKAASGWRVHEIYLKLISDKNDLQEMMGYVQKNPYTIEDYASRLLAEYPQEVKEIYSNVILQAADKSSNRKEYKKVCAMIKRYKKHIDADATSAIVRQLQASYYKRPAFLDELYNI